MSATIIAFPGRQQLPAPITQERLEHFVGLRAQAYAALKIVENERRAIRHALQRGAVVEPGWQVAELVDVPGAHGRPTRKLIIK